MSDIREKTLAGKRRLLFISPVFPDVTGFGLAMRAGVLVETLSDFFEIHLLIIPINDPLCDRLSPEILPFCAQHRIVRISQLERLRSRFGTSLFCRQSDEWITATGKLVGRAAEAYSGVQFDSICVFRFYMTPFAEPFLQTIPWNKRHLELDELESSTRLNLAGLYATNRLYSRARREKQAVARYAVREKNVLPQYGLLSVCSPVEAAHLKEFKLPGEVLVLQNVVRVPAEVSGPMRDGSAFTFLFVGNLNYYPNEDAVDFLIRRVLPLLPSTEGQRLCLQVVGAGADRLRKRYLGVPSCEFTGAVEDVAPFYRKANAVVVPVTAGGGTRIKVLEAFSYQRPVISTTAGVSGLDVENEQEALIADGAEKFAEQCRRVMENPVLCERMTARARLCLEMKYTLSALRIEIGNSIARVAAP